MGALRMFGFQTIPEKKKIFFLFKIYKYVLDKSESVVWFGDRLTGGVSGVTEMGAMFSLHLPRYMD